jgi:predicted transcriptional regulator
MRLGRILKVLEGGGFVEVKKKGRLNMIVLTPLGRGYAKALQRGGDK